MRCKDVEGRKWKIGYKIYVVGYRMVRGGGRIE